MVWQGDWSQAAALIPDRDQDHPDTIPRPPHSKFHQRCATLARRRDLKLLLSGALKKSAASARITSGLAEPEPNRVYLCVVLKEMNH